MNMPGRKFNAGSGYRYGFNGKEKDNDISEGGQDYGMRIYQARLGRFLSVDPLIAKFAFYSPYHFAGNSPIVAEDLDGAEPINFTSNLENKVKKEQAALKAIGAHHAFSNQLIQAGAGLSVLKTLEGAANLVRSQTDPLTSYAIGKGFIEKQKQIAADPVSQGLMNSGPAGALYVLLFKDDVSNLGTAIKNEDYVGMGESGTNIGINLATLYEGVGSLKNIGTAAKSLAVPQGLMKEEFQVMSQRIVNVAGDISDDIVVQGSRAAGTATIASDIDIAIKVSPKEFDQLIVKAFGTPNKGSALEKTMQHAIKTGKIQAGEAGLSTLRKNLEKFLGMKVDVSIVKKGGTFDNGAQIPVKGVKTP